MDKQKLIEKNKTEIVFNERNILVKVNSEKVVKLFYAFQNVFFVEIELKIVFCFGVLRWGRIVFLPS